MPGPDALDSWGNDNMSEILLRFEVSVSVTYEAILIPGSPPEQDRLMENTTGLERPPTPLKAVVEIYLEVPLIRGR